MSPTPSKYDCMYVYISSHFLEYNDSNAYLMHKYSMYTSLADAVNI